jgi:hypothetical protein
MLNSAAERRSQINRETRCLQLKHPVVLFSVNAVVHETIITLGQSRSQAYEDGCDEMWGVDVEGQGKYGVCESRRAKRYAEKQVG